MSATISWQSAPAILLPLLRGSAIGSTPAFGAGYPGSSPGPGANLYPRIESMTTPDLALGLIWYLVFLFSTTCHEASHAFVAKLGGDVTAAEGGQVTLNPIPHIVRSPWGMVVIPIISYLVGGWMIGWASAPFDPNWQRQYPRRSAWMALAGPASNFTLMLLAGIAIRVGVAAGYFRAPLAIGSYGGLVASMNTAGPTFLTTALSILFVLNLLLGTFNLLPVPPLDGSTGIMVAMPENAAVRYLDWVRSSGNFALIGLLIAWRFFGEIFQPVLFFALHVLYSGLPRA
jgi:Zn-dependent protease